MRAIILAFTQYVDLARPTPRHPQDVWLCKEEPGVPVCAESGKKVCDMYYEDERYTCIECHKTYFECKSCCEIRNDSDQMDYNSRCDVCKKLILVCYNCIRTSYTEKLHFLENVYECGYCTNVICQEHSIDAHCDDCDIAIKVCPDPHANIDTTTVYCHQCQNVRNSLFT
jgi:hypothetical protein